MSDMTKALIGVTAFFLVVFVAVQADRGREAGARAGGSEISSSSRSALGPGDKGVMAYVSLATVAPEYEPRKGLGEQAFVLQKGDSVMVLSTGMHSSRSEERRVGKECRSR